MTQTLATRYYVTRDPESEFPELNGNTGSIISQDPHAAAITPAITESQPSIMSPSCLAH